MIESNENNDHLIIEAEARVLDIEPVPRCSKCTRAFDEVKVCRSPKNPDLCKDCVDDDEKALATRSKDNSLWVQRAEEAGIPLWEQQPDESPDEFMMWEAYRDLWPAVRPTVTKVASTLNMSVGTVQRAMRKWTWVARLQAWIREVNADRTAELRAERRKMVEDQVKLGSKLRGKLLKAVDNLDEYDVTPGELVQLLKVTQSLEDTARDSMDAIEADTANDIDTMPNGLFAGEQDEQRGNAAGISAEDAAEVVKILSAAGVLSIPGTKVGVKQTTTTEVVAQSEL